MWGTDDIKTVNTILSSAAQAVLAKSVPSHHFIVFSSHHFIVFSPLPFPFSEPGRIVFAKSEDEIWPNHLSLRFSTMARSSSYCPVGDTTMYL